ncbi:hypothetical protein K402DRAFT_196619 [Aulographum hederae CBS 113979]|uniref:Uncharacterized protein n=1 Tax=Aulographum hederae CBS 113979 TaxID=1176131 RepID=A0A6G1GMY0_9PEZI|nr:hypothetical protein K402DRAFT_196619 [Aulographum hederae CBS 113979]
MVNKRTALTDQSNNAAMATQTTISNTSQVQSGDLDSSDIERQIDISEGEEPKRTREPPAERLHTKHPITEREPIDMVNERTALTDQSSNAAMATQTTISNTSQVQGGDLDSSDSERQIDISEGEEPKRIARRRARFGEPNRSNSISPRKSNRRFTFNRQKDDLVLLEHTTHAGEESTIQQARFANAAQFKAAIEEGGIDGAFKTLVVMIQDLELADKLNEDLQQRASWGRCGGKRITSGVSRSQRHRSWVNDLESVRKKLCSLNPGEDVHQIDTIPTFTEYLHVVEISAVGVPVTAWGPGTAYV